MGLPKSRCRLSGGVLGIGERGREVPFASSIYEIPDLQGFSNVKLAVLAEN